MKEKDYYSAIQAWFREDKKCEDIDTEYSFDDLALLTGDVVSSKGDVVYACELKNYPYPVGSTGWGSIGQALALRQKAHLNYVGCVASDKPGNNNWRRVTAIRTIRNLLSHLDIASPETFDQYRNALERIFLYFFGGLGIGLLVVHESLSDGQKVFEIVAPRQMGENDRTGR